MEALNSVAIICQTWLRDSHSLFDYESRNVLPKELTVTPPCTIVRLGSDVFVQDSGTFGLDVCPLVHIEEVAGQIQVRGAAGFLWHILRYMPEGTILKEGTVLKLGRVSIRVKAVKASEDSDSGAQTQESSDNEEECPTLGHCKFCFGEDTEPDNPLITPCQCSGTVQFIHLKCLQQWIDSRKLVRQSANCINATWKSMACELCKTPYPAKITSNGKSFRLAAAEGAQVPYIVFEPAENSQTVGVQAVSFIHKGPVHVGRGHDSDVRVSDISVSRVHAAITLADGHFQLEDRGSKFGTLLKDEDPAILTHDSCVTVQTGRTVLTLSLS